MCGIAGLINLDGFPLSARGTLEAMAERLQHRGPDDAGLLEDGPVGFAFRRLSIIDLATGEQPVSNEDGTIWVMLNGEIYNYVELAKTLKRYGHQFKTLSDTETIVHAYEEYGLDFVTHLRGMFAIALWDSLRQKLIVVRDRMGQKPLFHSCRHGQFAFASELKALTVWEYFDNGISPEALHDYLSFLNVPQPNSIFAQTHKLPPGHMLTVDLHDGSIREKPYWTVNFKPDYSLTLDDYSDLLRTELEEAVRIRLRSDVPIAAFLSGGVDSTIIVGLMSQHMPHLKTIGIGFDDEVFDESTYQHVVANRFQTDHKTEQLNSASITPDQLLDLIWFIDEPFADPAFIPAYKMSSAARQHATVVLSGDGGDELFGGYTRYGFLNQLNSLAKLPEVICQVSSNIISGTRSIVPPDFAKIDNRLRQIGKALNLCQSSYNERVYSLSCYFDESDKWDLYDSNWRLQLGDYTSLDRISRQLFELKGTENDLAKFVARDLTQSMVNGGLVKVDRSSMACSLEIRSPFLDHKVVELAARIPFAYKRNGRQSKIVLKKACADLIPPTIKNRTKQGLEVPLNHWLGKGELRSLLMDTLSSNSIHSQGIFNRRKIDYWLNTFLNNSSATKMGISAHQLRRRIWALFIFQLWYNKFVK